MEGITNSLANRICTIKNGDELTYKKIKYGLDVIFINISKFFIVFLSALILGIFKEVVILSLGMIAIRRVAFGVHAKTSLGCTIFTLIETIGGAYLIKIINCTSYLVIGTFLITFLLLLMYAPADTEKRPIIGEKRRKKLKYKALITSFILLLISIFLSDKQIAMLIMMGALEAALMTTPLIYKIFKVRYKNYEQFERKLN